MFLNVSQRLTTSVVARKCFFRNHSSTNLLLDKGFINGVWVGATSNKTFEVLNPSTGNVIAQVADMGKGETEAAIDAAHNRFHSKEWQSLTAKDRSNLLKVSNTTAGQSR